MTKKISYAALAIAFIALCVPLAADADVTGFQNSGIFGCNLSGAYSMSVGSVAASGGTFVPVSDATVEANTGYMVYDECVLRNVVDRLRESATSQLQQQQISTLSTGRNGQAYFPQQFGLEQQNVGTQAVSSALPIVVSAINPAYQSQVQTALVTNYYLSTNAPQQSLSCPYTGNLATAYTPQATDFWGPLQAAQYPGCIEMAVYYNGQGLLGNAAATAQNAWLTQLNWGNGFYSVTNSQGIVTTPGYLVGQTANQAVQSGYQQLQSANDIGQMVGALFAGLSTQILSQSAGGLTGLLASAAGQPSYLSQVQTESENGLLQAVTNTALQVLESAINVENQYYQAQSSLAGTFSQTISQLRSTEGQCWQAVEQSVCAPNSVSADGSSCKSSAGATLTIATSTVFSQNIIDSTITPLASSTATNLNASYAALQQLTALAQGVENTTAPAAQQAALEQLDTLVSQNALHTQADVQNASNDEETAQQAMTTLLQNTVQTWSAATPVGSPFNAENQTGWCNATNPTTIALWTQAWSAQ